MEKTVALISRRADLTRPAFREYYETNHAFLGMRHFAFRKYLRNHVVDTAGAGPGFDVFSEFWNESIANAYATLASPIGDLMREDERRFMDQSKQRAARSTERLVAGPPRGIDPTPTRKQILVLTNDGDADRAAFFDMAARWGAALAAAAPGETHRITLDAITPFENAPFPCDAILSVWLAHARHGVTYGTPPAGITLLAVATVESCETTPEVLAANYKGGVAR